jgi:energy-coupling factor transporter ATP-binding protein EcfA2
MLSLSGIQAFYGETQALFGVSLEVNEGEVVALLGPNGAGKTTTLRSILNLSSVKEGRITFDGKDIKFSFNVNAQGMDLKIDFVGVWEDVRPGAYEPQAMLEELQLDGIWGAVVQPSQGLFWYHIEDSELLSALCQAYNDWIADFCRPAPGRLRGIGMINVDDPAEASAELERCARLGLAGVFIPVTPLPGQPYRHAMYERLWATAQDANLPLLMHLATQRANVPGCEISISFKTFTPAGLRPTQDYWVRYAMTDMIFAGVFERHPRLRVGSVAGASASRASPPCRAIFSPVSFSMAATASRSSRVARVMAMPDMPARPVRPMRWM